MLRKARPIDLSSHLDFLRLKEVITMTQMQARQIKLGAVLEGIGVEQLPWRDPDLPGDASINIDWYIENARLAEEAKFDFVFIADSPLITADSGPHVLNRLEPLTLLSAVAVATSKIGLVATLTTSYWEPYNVARQFGSLDNISRGRAGWNVVTTAVTDAARNYGRDEHFDHKVRYDRARESVEVCQGLWDSYEDDAFPRDKERGIFLDKTKQHRLDHKGAHFSVAGPLALTRSKQGYPVIFQSGASEDGRNLAARIGEGIFADSGEFEENQIYSADLRARTAALGRDPDIILVMPGVDLVIAETDEAAQAINEARNKTLEVNKLLFQLGRLFNNYNFLKHDFDAPFPDHAVEKIPKSSTNERIVRTAREERLSLRQAAYRFNALTGRFVGSPETIANEIERWFVGCAADGFNVRVTRPKEFALFRERVVPILQARGLFRMDYDHDTLRGHLGLPVPENRYAATRKQNSSL